MSREERSPPPTDTTTRQTTTSSRTHDPSSSRRRAPSPPPQQPEASTSTGITRSRRRDPPEPEPEQERMSKRLRRGSVGSSSEGDTEKNPTPPPPTQKKKRTRTLTTPHQSAVLHALLAQSRFPTTAMREEVGRSIGLSARKVQIWFQNQRQKARRPRSQSDIPLTRPPQYGPFPTSSHPHPLPPSFPPHYGYPPGTGPPPPPAYYEPSSSSLLGPGMPGRSFPAPPPQPSPFRYPRLASPPPPALSRRIDYSRTLPPLAFPGESPRPSSSSFRGTSPYPRSPPYYRAGASPAPRSTYHRSPSPERILPPPVQWEGPPQRFGGTWARPSSGSGTVLSPVHARRYSLESPAPRRSGRYDPVRGTVVPAEPTPPPEEDQS
ncbi:hypothetical protein IW261DRAFT_1679823 [Armillaria novae-zelandiae]|uniref:Homeobox domain-containing protein n=1 Tax=Armillaria novae-zelandiae TaxID=153914 RepID=A0AA39TS84_9AGAR|nr:hypothetical protein IW261DRAFT_1679823 [Armillaria novae-zelandiae]